MAENSVTAKSIGVFVGLLHANLRCAKGDSVISE